MILNSGGPFRSDPLGHEAAQTKSPWPWFALQVRTRHEMGIADHLQLTGYESFLPLYKSRRLWSDRIKEVDTPLFPGYLFCRFNPRNWLPILKHPGVIQIVGYNRIPTPIDDSEIDAVRILGASGLPNQPWPFPKVGDRVRIESGPLRGAEGLLVEFKNSRRFVVSVTLLQRSVAVEVDSLYVTVLSSLTTGRVQHICT
jgi:transcription antitermination factor NusG